MGSSKQLFLASPALNIMSWMNMNVGVSNSASSYHDRGVAEYKKMSLMPTKANLEIRLLEQEQPALQIQQQDERTSMSSLEKDSASASPNEQANSRTGPWSEVRRVSGNFNAPTHIEIERHNETSSPRGFRGTIKGWVKKSPPVPAV